MRYFMPRTQVEALKPTRRIFMGKEEHFVWFPSGSYAVGSAHPMGDIGGACSFTCYLVRGALKGSLKRFREFSLFRGHRGWGSSSLRNATRRELPGSLLRRAIQEAECWRLPTLHRSSGWRTHECFWQIGGRPSEEMDRLELLDSFSNKLPKRAVRLQQTVLELELEGTLRWDWRTHKSASEKKVSFKHNQTGLLAGPFKLDSPCLPSASVPLSCAPFGEWQLARGEEGIGKRPSWFYSLPGGGWGKSWLLSENWFVN